MCSEIFRIPLEIGGLPLFGFGVFMAVLWGASLWSVVLLARRSGWDVALKSQIPSLLVGTTILWMLPRYFSEGLPIRGYGLMVLAGSMLGIAMAIARGQRVGIAAEEFMSLAMWMFGGGILGARLFYVIEYWETRICHRDAQGAINWLATLQEALSYTEGGLVIYGAFLGASAAFFFFARRRGLPALALADLIAPSLLAGLALGRIGCLLNGCCYGGPTTDPWGIRFPRMNAPQTFSMPYLEQASEGLFYGFRLEQEKSTSLRPRVGMVMEGSVAASAGVKAGMRLARINGEPVDALAQSEHALWEALAHHEGLRLETTDGEIVEMEPIDIPERSLPVQPTQVFSAINAALLAWVLWSYYPLRRRDGQVVALMLLAYPLARFLLEIIRIDEAAVFHTRMSISQNISIALFLIAAWLWRRLSRLPPYCADLALHGAPP